MIVIYKGNTASTFTTTFSEKLSYYNLSGATTTGLTFWFHVENDTTKSIYDFSLNDSSLYPWRYNYFTLDETSFNFTNGFYSYTGSTTSGYTDVLEVGKLLVSGTNTTNKIFW